MSAKWVKFTDELPDDHSYIIFSDLKGWFKGNGYFVMEDRDEWDSDLYWMYFPKVEIQ